MGGRSRWTGSVYSFAAFVAGGELRDAGQWYSDWEHVTNRAWEAPFESFGS